MSKLALCLVVIHSLHLEYFLEKYLQSFGFWVLLCHVLDHFLLCLQLFSN